MRMTYMILIANNTVKLSKRDKAGKQYLWILITTYYLLSKNWDIFATRCRISLIINTDYFRGGQVKCKPRAMPCLHEHCRGAAFIRRSQIILKKYIYERGSRLGSLFHFSIRQYSMCLVVRLLWKLNWTSFRALPIFWKGVSGSKLG